MSAIFDASKTQRLTTLLDELLSRDSRPLIFSQWKIVLDILETVIRERGHKYVRLDGGTAVEERQRICDAYNREGSDIFCFLLSTRAGGQGLNLTGADTVIIHDCDFNPQIDRQAEDRCHRLGQTKPVTIYRLVTEKSVDERIVAIAERKLAGPVSVLRIPPHQTLRPTCQAAAASSTRHVFQRRLSPNDVCTVKITCIPRVYLSCVPGTQ